jgi:hypothetical protein
MREGLQPLHQVGVVRFPFYDGFQLPLNFEHITADGMLGAALLGENPFDKRFGSIANGANLSSIENVASRHEAERFEFGPLTLLESESLAHRFSLRRSG